MTADLSALEGENRIIFEVKLKPVQGQRFQPTGFPDLGHATYQAGATACLLVESSQSMANRLEETIWDHGANQPVQAVRGISYVQVNESNGDESSFLSSSMLEAHRLNSPYIEKSKYNGSDFSGYLIEALSVNKNRPVNRRAFLNGLLKHDVNSLIHGVFLESLDGRLRIPRSLSSFVEATNVQRVDSGGARIDRVNPGTDDDNTSSEGFGNRPYHRQEYTGEITAYFSLDLQQIRGYGLGENETNLLILLSLYKVRKLLDGDLRLRTACDLEIEGDIEMKRPSEFELPSAADLEASLRDLHIGLPTEEDNADANTNGDDSPEENVSSTSTAEDEGDQTRVARIADMTVTQVTFTFPS